MEHTLFPASCNAYGPFGKKCNTELLEQVCDTAAEEQAAHETPTFCHRLEFASRKVLEFVLGFRLMGFQFLMLQMVPDFLIRIPVRGILRQMTHMKPRLLFDEGVSFFQGVWRRLIPDNNQVATRMMPQHS